MPDKLVSPGGKPLITEPNLIVVKAVRGAELPPNLLQMLHQATGCAVALVPFNCEIVKGNVAEDELRMMHTLVHELLKVPKSDMSNEELEVLYGALYYVCENTKPREDSVQVRLMKRLEGLIDGEEKG